jgi:hypothetical protein
MAALDQLPLVLRIGTKEFPPQLLLTGTPRPLKKIEDAALREGRASGKKILKAGVILLTGSSLANRANLAPDDRPEHEAIAGTRWGQQEVAEAADGRPRRDLRLGEVGRVEPMPNLEVVAKQLIGGSSRWIQRRRRETGADESGIIVEGREAESAS